MFGYTGELERGRENFAISEHSWPHLGGGLSRFSTSFPQDWNGDCFPYITN